MKTFPNSEINLKTAQIFVDHKKRLENLSLGFCEINKVCPPLEA
jgi:hypothetical protein